MFFGHPCAKSAAGHGCAGRNGTWSLHGGGTGSHGDTPCTHKQGQRLIRHPRSPDKDVRRTSRITRARRMVVHCKPHASPPRVHPMVHRDPGKPWQVHGPSYPGPQSHSSPDSQSNAPSSFGSRFDCRGETTEILATAQPRITSVD